jgi:hypothetical protein
VTKVVYNAVTTEHETAIDVATRLAACCTFYYSDSGEEMRKHGRYPGPERDVWLVFTMAITFTDTSWRVVDPQSWIEDDEEVIAYVIDGRSPKVKLVVRSWP